MSEKLLDNEYKILVNLKQKDQELISALGEMSLVIRKTKEKLEEQERISEKLEKEIENHRKQMMSYYRSILEAHGLEKGAIDLENKEIVTESPQNHSS